MNSLDTLVHLLGGVAGLISFAGALWSPGMRQARPLLLLAQVVAVAPFLLSRVADCFPNLAGASSAAVFEIIGISLGLLGCVRLLLLLEAPARETGRAGLADAKDGELPALPVSRSQP